MRNRGGVSGGGSCPGGRTRRAGAPMATFRKWPATHGRTRRQRMVEPASSHFIVSRKTGPQMGWRPRQVRTLRRPNEEREKRKMGMFCRLLFCRRHAVWRAAL